MTVVLDCVITIALAPFVFVVVNAFDVPLPAMSRDVVDLGDSFPLCHSERWRSACDGERGTPGMFVVYIPQQGISARN
jgi:hypothetical protein